MVDVKKVPTDVLLKNLAEGFKSNKKIKIPEWVEFAKAGIHKEKAWEQPDWYYTRLASTLRKVFIMGPIGISKLSEEYGGRVDRGSKRYHPAKGSRSIVRHMLQTLEELGLVKKVTEGRVISPEGNSLLDKVSKDTLTTLSEKDKTFEKFL